MSLKDIVDKYCPPKPVQPEDDDIYFNYNEEEGDGLISVHCAGTQMDFVDVSEILPDDFRVTMVETDETELIVHFENPWVVDQ